MRTILILLAAACLSSCSIYDEQAWAQSTRDFMLASELRHAAYSQRMAAAAKLER